MTGIYLLHNDLHYNGLKTDLGIMAYHLRNHQI